MHDPKGGYYKGPTGTVRDYIDPEMTTRESVGVAWKEAKRQWKLLKEDFVYYNTFRERDANSVYCREIFARNVTISSISSSVAKQS